MSMDITKAAGISEVGRSRLGQLVRAIPGPIRVADAARVLGLDPKRTTWLLSAWVRRGWLQRLARGVYVPVSIETQAGTRPAADPWVVAAAVFQQVKNGHRALSIPLMRNLSFVMPTKVTQGLSWIEVLWKAIPTQFWKV